LAIGRTVGNDLSIDIGTASLIRAIIEPMGEVGIVTIAGNIAVFATELGVGYVDHVGDALLTTGSQR